MNDSSVTRRQLGILFTAAGVLMLALLCAHPHENVHTFADVVEFEISRRLVNGLVHGGMIVLLVPLLAGHIGLARLIGATQLAVTIAVTAFAGGCIFLAASLVLDGFVTPALALQYRVTQDLALQHTIEPLVHFCGTIIRILMPAALLAFAASALAWCGPLIRAGSRSRIAGAISGAIGLTVGVMMLAVAPAALSHALLGGLFLVGLWQFALATAAFNVNGQPPRTVTS